MINHSVLITSFAMRTPEPPLRQLGLTVGASARTRGQALYGARLARWACSGFVIVLALCVLSGCATAPLSLREATARAIGSVKPEQIMIPAVRSSSTATRWIGVTPQGRYVCVSLDRLRHTRCVKQSSGPAAHPFGWPGSAG